MFGSIYWWVVKLGMAAAIAAGGYLLNATGFDVALAGAQSPATLWWMRLFDVTVPALGSLIAIGLIAAYPITEATAYRTRTLLEERRGKTSAG
jgi:GPH family glycoside/pentoside/hexuronide:cation symporter